MKYIKQRISIIPILLMSLSVQAKVNMKDASYFETWSDHKFIQRTYNSRSVYRGYFGFGWCSNIEKRISISERKIHLHDCLTNEEPSYELGRQVFKIKNEYVFFSNNKVDKKFDLQGRLVGLRLPNDFINLVYDRFSGLKEVHNSKGEILRVNYNQKYQRIDRLESSHGRVFYGFQGGNLHLVISHLVGPDSSKTKERYVYHYSRWNNLLKIEYPDNTTKLINYDEDQDLILSLVRRDQCSEKFHYSFFKKSENKQVISYMSSTRSTYCQNKEIAHSKMKFEFWHKGMRSENAVRLIKIRISNSRKVMETKYNLQGKEVYTKGRTI